MPFVGSGGVSVFGSAGGGGGSVAGSLVPFRLIADGSRLGEFPSLGSTGLLNFLEAGRITNPNGMYEIQVAPGPYRPLTASDPGAGCINFTRALVMRNLAIKPQVAGDTVVIDHSVVSAADQANGGDGLFIQFSGAAGVTYNYSVEGLDVTGSRRQSANDNNFVSVKCGGTQLSHSASPWSVTVRRCAMRKFTNGILTVNSWAGTISMYESLVEDCAADGQSHGVYLAELLSAYIEGCEFRSTSDAFPVDNIGHLFKCRAGTLRIKASKFDNRGGGSSRLIDLPNGGDVEVTGSIFFKRDETTSPNQIMSFGTEQRINNFVTAPGGGQYNYDGRTHRLKFAQNTVVDLETPTQPFILIGGPGDPMVNDSGRPASIVTTDGNGDMIRNNIFAAGSGAVQWREAVANGGSSDSAAVDLFGLHPNNSLVAVSSINDNGGLLTSTITGSPAVADADKQFSGTMQTAASRTETNRGAFGSALPAYLVGQAVGEWRRLTASRPSLAQDPSWIDGTGPQGSLKGVSGPGDAIGAWGTMVRYLNKWRNLASGGHEGFAGNFVLVWDMLAAAPVCVVEKASTLAGLTRINARTYLDGAPISRHPYYSKFACPSIGRVVLVGSAATWTGVNAGGSLGFYPNITGYDVTNHAWDADGTYTDCPASNIHADTCMFQDPVNEAIYVFGAGGQFGQDPNSLRRWNVGTPGTWDVIWAWNGNALLSPAANKPAVGIDSRRRRAFFLGMNPFYSGGNGPCLVTLPIAVQSGSTNDQSGITQYTFSGPAASVLASFGPTCGIAFTAHPTDPSQDWFYLKQSPTGGQVYRVSAIPQGSSLYCEEFTTTGGSAILGSEGAGLYRRFTDFPDLGGCAFLGVYTDDVWFLRTV